MTTMLEKMAAAACRSYGFTAPWDRVQPDTKARFIALARAALQAIREPDEAMQRAMADVDFIWPSESDDPGTWRAAIDAILNEKPETAEYKPVQTVRVADDYPVAYVPKGSERPKVGARARLQSGEALADYVITDVEDVGDRWRMSMRPDRDPNSAP